MMVVTSFGVVGENVDMYQQNEPADDPPEKLLEVPIPFQTWEFDPGNNALRDIIFFNPEDENASVYLQRSYILLPKAISLDNLTWEKMPPDEEWTYVDNMTFELGAGNETSFVIENMIPWVNNAAIVRYWVAWADDPIRIESRFLNEVTIDWELEGIKDWWSNFDVHNSWDGKINNFELELYGDIDTTDIKGHYDPPGDPLKNDEGIWYGGWGAPPVISDKGDFVEVMWFNESHKGIPYCESVHLGIYIDIDAHITYARGHLTYTKSRDISRNNIFNTLFLRFFENNPNIFPLLQLILKGLGLY